MSDLQVFIYSFTFALAMGVFDLGVLFLTLQPQIKKYVAYRASTEYKDKQEMKRIKKLEAWELKQAKREVRKAADKIRKRLEDSLTAQKMVWVYERSGGMNRKMKKVQIKNILYTLDEVWLRIDDKPWGVTWNKLLKPEVLEDIRIDIGRKDADWVIDEVEGVFLRTYLRSSIAGIPSIYRWHQGARTDTALANTPKRKRFAIPIGLGANRYHHWLDLDGNAGPHMIVGGSTGGGKSVFLNQVLCTLLSKNSPKELQLLLVDLKRVELWDYRGLPHLWQDIILEPSEILPALERVLNELERRTILFQEKGVKSIDAWNETQPERLPHLMVVFDEFASVMESPEKKKAEVQLVKLSRLGRFAGFKMIYCTQRPSAEIITGSIQSNVTTRVAFRTNNTGSQVILGSWEASQLPAIDGRCVYKTGAEVHEVQAPMITDRQIRGIVASAKREKKEQQSLAVKVFKNALDRYGGKCTLSLVEKEFKDQIPQWKIKKLLSSSAYDPEKKSPVFSFSGQRHLLSLVSDGRRGAKPYYVIPLNGHDLPGQPDEVQAIFDHWKLENK